MIFNRLLATVFLLIIIIILLLLWKPDFMYDSKKKQYRKFGLSFSKGETIITFEILLVFCSIVSYLIVYMIYDDRNLIFVENTPMINKHPFNNNPIYGGNVNSHSNNNNGIRYHHQLPYLSSDLKNYYRTYQNY